MNIDVKFDSDVAEVRIDGFAKYTVWAFRRKDQEGAYQEIHAYSWDGPKGFDGDNANYDVAQHLCGIIDGEYSEQTMHDYIIDAVNAWASRCEALENK